MKSTTFCLLFAVLAGISSCSPKKDLAKSTGAQESITVMSYNVHHCNPPAKTGIIDVAAIAAVINAEKPDLVGLQEIDVNTIRSGKGKNQAQELALKTGMNFYFAKAIDHEGGDYGVAILSRYTIEEPKVYKLPTDPATKGEPRVLVTAKIKLPSGQTIRFANTHLDAQKAPVNREMQIKEINAIASKESLPMIITGDFNAVANTTVINTMDEVFTRTCAECAFSIPASRPNKCIDFIAFKTGKPFQVLSHHVVPESEASDHRPVVSKLKL
jgi:endonuclease/exonuclease/phosphatase family metal-dependent hydrolase